MPLTLYDHTGTPFDRVKASPNATLGAMGTIVVGGYIQQNEKSSELVGTTRYQTYSDILANTAIVAAGVRYFLNLVGKAKWTAKPVDDSPQAEEIAELTEDIMNDMLTPWNRVVRRTAMYKFYGFSIQEWTAKRRDDGLIGMLDVAPRAQKTIERWDVDLQGRVSGVMQRVPQNGVEVYLPRDKLVYVVDDSLNDSPEGLGLFRHIVDSAKMLARYEQLEGFGYETDLRGIPMGRAPLAGIAAAVKTNDITQAQANDILAPMKSFVENHIKVPDQGLMVDSAPYRGKDATAAPSGPEQWGMELLKGGSTGQAEVAKAISRLNYDIARIIGVESLLLGSEGKGGNRALAKTQTDNLMLIIDSTLKEMAEAYDKDYVATLGRLNGWQKDLWPSMQPEAIQYRDIEQLSEMLYKMALAGAVLDPSDPAINALRQQANLPDQPEMIDLDSDLGLGGEPSLDDIPEPEEDDE